MCLLLPVACQAHRPPDTVAPLVFGNYSCAALAMIRGLGVLSHVPVLADCQTLSVLW